jgi:hypothetical protein
MELKNIVKFILAGITAFGALNILCFIYYNLPVHLTSKTGTTDYIWESNAHYSKMTEGYGYGKMNNEGYNNIDNYNKQSIDILIMGSSQMEGTNVPQILTTATLLNKLFSTKYVYNIGISGHDFPHIVNNFETAVKFYEPNGYVIIEIGSLQFNAQALEESIKENLKRIPSYNNKIMFLLQKIPYLRLLYSQYKYFTGKDDDDSPQQSNIVSDMAGYSVTLDAVMNKLHLVSTEHGIKTIIFYHPHFSLDNNISIFENTDYEHLKIFERSCFNNNIVFISMANAFIEGYKKDHTLPHGFFNTAVGAGHLNRNGHKIIADELFQQINIMEKGGSI